MECCGLRNNTYASLSVMLPHHHEAGTIFIEKAGRKAKLLTKSFLSKLSNFSKNPRRRSSAFISNPFGGLLPNAFLVFRFNYRNFIWSDQLINVVQMATELCAEVGDGMKG